MEHDMKWSNQVCLLLLLLSAPTLWAADLKADESAIRAAIASKQAKKTDDAIFWSGAYKRPVIGSEKGEEFPGHEISKRRNIKVTNDVQRIDIAASGDLAYEFSYGSLSYDLDAVPPQHIAFKTGILRVWKKVNGDWEVAAAFVRPLDTPFDRAAMTAENK
jgi:ketosteroid isomerase-like protein